MTVQGEARDGLRGLGLTFTEEEWDSCWNDCMALDDEDHEGKREDEFWRGLVDDLLEMEKNPALKDRQINWASSSMTLG